MRQPLRPGGATVDLTAECSRKEEDVQDIRVNPDGVDMRGVGNIYHSTLKRIAYAADPDPGHPTAKKLLRLIDQERQELAALRKDGIDYMGRQDHIAKSERRREINALYLKLGMASMLTLGDWSVNRDAEIPVSMGVAPFAEIESMLLNFHHENGLIADTAPIREGKLVHLDLGCGNGVVANRLRQNETVYPFDNGRVLLNYWAEVGYADRIYWTLNDFLRVFVKDEYRDNPALNEFIDVISTLLMRRIHFGSTFDTKPSKNMKTLLKLPTDPNVIREVLLDLGTHIRNLSRLKTIKADGEFLLDTDKPISEECRTIIREFYGVGDTTTFEIKRGTAKPAAFFKKYFKPELYEVNRDLEKDVREINEEIHMASLELADHTLKLMVVERKKDAPDYARRREAAIAARSECYKRHKDLVRKRDELLARKINLAEFITIYPHNVVLGDFDEFGNLFPEKPTFDFVHSKRAISHGQNPSYAAITGQVARRLKPGGIVIEDGKRESYTREERIDALVALQKELGPEYRIGVISDDRGTKSVLMQRAITKADGEMVFFADSYGNRCGFILRGHTYCPIEKFSVRWPEIIFRNWIIQRLKKLYIDESLEGVAPEEVPSRVWHGRMQFRGLHAEVDRILETHVFSTAEWQNRLRTADPSSSEYQALLHSVWGRITKEIDHVRRRVKIVTDGAIPLRTGDFDTVSLPPRETMDDTDDTHEICKQRHTSVENMPRNMNVPDLAALETERVQLVALLQKLREKTGEPPLVVVEFDNCFTNPLLRRTLQTLVGEEGMRDLVAVENVKLKSGKYPPQRDGCVYIIGGSLNDTYDPLGRNFTENFSHPLVDRIQKDEAVRAVGICFGHQSLVEAYGRVHGLPFETKRGSLEFGAFPVKFAGSHACLKHLADKTCTASMTRSGYTVVPGYQNVQDMRPLAYEDSEVPPVAFALEQGRIVTCQFHPDVWTSDPHDRHVLQKYLERNHELVQRTFGRPDLGRVGRDTRKKVGVAGPAMTVMPCGLNSQNYIFDHNVTLDAEDKTGRRMPWVAREAGPAFLIPTLTHLSRGLLQALRTKTK